MLRIITESIVSIMLTKTNQILVPNFRGIMLIQHNDLFIYHARELKILIIIIIFFYKNCNILPLNNKCMCKINSWKVEQ